MRVDDQKRREVTCTDGADHRSTGRFQPRVGAERLVAPTAHPDVEPRPYPTRRVEKEAGEPLSEAGGAGPPSGTVDGAHHGRIVGGKRVARPPRESPGDVLDQPPDHPPG